MINLNQSLQNPARIFLTILASLLLILGIRLVQLQIIEHHKYLMLAEDNASHVRKMLAPRGIIYDRYGKVILSNRPVISICVQPVPLHNNPGAISKLSAILNLPKADLLEKVKSGLNRPFEALVLKNNAFLDTVTKIEEQKYNLPGVFVQVRPARSYTYGNTAAHLLGYIGEITKDELDILKDYGYKSGDVIGKGGIEKNYDSFLRGVDGEEKIEVDVFGKVGRKRENLDPIPGSDLKLTLDIELQEQVDKALAGKKGAVVVLDPKNGEVLALGSSPTFDPSLFSIPLDAKKWQSISRHGFPFLNRALSAYPTGSTFKVVNMAAALDNKLFTKESIFHCPGFFNLGGRIARCWKEGGHGTINLYEGLVWSCDVVFYTTALKEQPTLLSNYAKNFGLGEKTGIDLPNESAGTVPSIEWKKEKFGLNWYPGDTINFGIGQGFLQATPLQMALVYSQIANRGYRYKPYIVREIADRNGNILKFNKPELLSKLSVSADVLTIIENALTDVIERGTGRRVKMEGVKFAGKTGTAEDPPRKPHAWFMCYGPIGNPQIVVVVFIEQGEHGDRSAASVAKDILLWYKDNRLKT